METMQDCANSYGQLYRLFKMKKCLCSQSLKLIEFYSQEKTKS